MIKEFAAFFTLFKQGKELTNSKTWKNRAIAANALTAVLGAAVVIAGGFGYEIKLEQGQIEAVAAGVAALYGMLNAIVHVVSSAKVGVPERGGAKSGSPTLDSRDSAG